MDLFSLCDLRAPSSVSSVLTQELSVSMGISDTIELARPHLTKEIRPGCWLHQQLFLSAPASVGAQHCCAPVQQDRQCLRLKTYAP
jgi:hypothetical protein